MLTEPIPDMASTDAVPTTPSPAAPAVRTLQRDPLEFLATFLPRETRKLARTGVSLHCLEYWTPALGPYVGRKVSVEVHYDPRDVSFVYVRLPGGVLTRATLTTPDVGPISLAEWVSRRQHERRLCRASRNSPEALDSRARAQALVAHAKASRRLQRRRASAAAGDAWLTRTPAPPAPPPASAAAPKTAVAEQAPIEVAAFAFEEVANGS